MLQLSFPPFAFASLLVGLAATAQAAPAGGSAPRSVVLTGKAGESPVLYLSPDVPTVILLDAPIIRESVEVEGRARFARVDPGDTGITLALAVPLGPKERLALRFTYRAGSPQTVVFLLTSQLGTVDTVVNVSRPQQTVEACRVELSATRERCEAQAKELEELKARPPAVSPAAVALAGLVDLKGMKAQAFREACREGNRPADAVLREVEDRREVCSAAIASRESTWPGSREPSAQEESSVREGFQRWGSNSSIRDCGWV